MRRVPLILAAALAFTLAPVVNGTSTPTAEAAASDIVAVVVEGTGFGHGRGMSQWGAYGYAVEHGWSWQQILNHYYGNTVEGVEDPNGFMTVRLLGLDGVPSVGLVSHGGGVKWADKTYTSMKAVWNGSSWTIYGAGHHTCNADSEGVPIGTTSSATFWTPDGDNPALAASSALGVCQPNGSVVHYRGAIDLGRPDGTTRVVNRLRTEDYLRGVVPREVSASWANAGSGAGANAVRAQAVAARSYAIAQNRYSYAKTCDTTSCQAYGGSATRSSAGGGSTVMEHSLTDAAIVATAGVVRKWPSNGAVVSTEFSASNGPRTAGGTFPPVDDLGDATASNPNHRWTRVISAAAIAQKYGTGALTSATMVEAASGVNQQFDGIWFNDVLLNGSRRVEAWTFRGDFGLPSPGFTVRVITRDTAPLSVGFIGDSVGEGIAGVFSTLTDGMFSSLTYDAVAGRCTVNTACPGSSGVEAAANLPANLDIVVVELGYNDWSPSMSSAIDQMMQALNARGVKQVLWVNLAASTGISSSASVYAGRNAALQDATGRWPTLSILDWNSASNTSEKYRWFESDGVHLRTTGDAQFALWLREQVAPFHHKVGAGQTLRFQVSGVGGVPASGVSAVALNVTAVDPSGWGFLTVWPCGSPKPDASNVNFVSAGAVEPNSVLAKVDSTGDVCVYSHSSTHVLVDVAGYFTAGFSSMTPVRTVDTRNGIGAPKAKVQPGSPLRVKVTDRAGVPASGVSAVALNVTAVDPSGWGFLTVWPCGSPKPDASNVNFVRAGAVEPNSVLAKVDGTGEVCIDTHASTHVLVDVAGYFTSGFEAMTPVRTVDTRHGIGAPAAKVVPGAPLRVKVTDRAGVPASGVSAVALNVTAVDPIGWGFLTVWPCGSPKPDASNVNFVSAGAVEPNSVLAKVDGTGEVCIDTHASTHVLVDVAGYFTSGFSSMTPVRTVDTRNGIGTL